MKRAISERRERGTLSGDKQCILYFNKREAAGFTVPVDTAGGFSLGQDECEGLEEAGMGSRSFQKFVILRAFFEEHFSLRRQVLRDPPLGSSGAF